MRLGCRPFHAGIRPYLDRKKGTWKDDTTAEQREGALRHIGDRLEALKGAGKVTTTDPRHISPQDVLNFAASIRNRRPSYQGRLMSLLNGYLRFYKNRALEDLLHSGDFKMPRATRAPIKYIQPTDLKAVFRTVTSMEGWHGTMARGMVALYFGTGLRPSELRLAEARDLDLRRERIYVRHPKGEGAWANPEWVDIIRGDMMPLIVRFWDERAAYLEQNGAESEALFPNIHSRSSAYYTDKSFRAVKDKVAKASGVDFSLKMFRSTLCTLTVNEDLSRLPAMSVQLRHAGPGTTTQYYAAIERSNAGRQLKAAWKETALGGLLEPDDLAPLTPKTGSIKC